jgi:uncharacterized protein (DUF427 family)
MARRRRYRVVPRYGPNSAAGRSSLFDGRSLPGTLGGTTGRPPRGPAASRTSEGSEMTETRTRLQPGPDHPITLYPHTGLVTVRAGTTVLAETSRALELREAAYPPVLYVPIADVERSHLRPSDRHTYCPFKGEASYYDIVGVGVGDLEDAVWYYPEPYPAVADIGDHVAFYPDRVSITSEPQVVPGV